MILARAELRATVKWEGWGRTRGASVQNATRFTVAGDQTFATDVRVPSDKSCSALSAASCSACHLTAVKTDH